MHAIDDVAVSLAGLHAKRWTTTNLYSGIKESHAIARIEAGRTRWWGRGAEWSGQAGSIITKEPGDVHRDLAHDGPVTVLCVLVPAALLDAVHERGRPVALPHLIARDARVAPLHRLLDAVGAGADRLTLEVALSEAATAYASLSRPLPVHSRPVRRALEYLRNNFAEAITLDDLERHSGLDKFHLCRAFRAQVGMPPYTYLTHLRVLHAKDLLRAGMRASDLAPAVGLYDQSQLTRHFRRIVGETPARYGSRYQSAL